ncbi:hypothetical protein GUJ93_ZPchr0001g29673 [Zizania palustris]|uniref:NAD(P)H-quinone oxidoreductase subunit O, chloroplastic n=1 Tax=Zizania palustris TaxID=103762 RepID=A0A8J5SEK2_ZIZPA|nr:hypothetical protein GUJ93_ZPchr0001g29673 [Zizania palustris]
MEALLSSPRALFSVTPHTPAAAWVSARRRRDALVKASASADPTGEEKPAAAGDGQAPAPAPKKILKKKPVYSMKKGQIVRVEKEKYLNSINVSTDRMLLPFPIPFPVLGCNLTSFSVWLLPAYHPFQYLSVGHPPFYKGLDYIYEDRGEVLDIRIFETGEYALIAWVGIPTPPAWLPTYMLIKSDKLDYERI